MTTHLKCLQVDCETYFVDDNRRRVCDSSLTVSDLPPRCQKVELKKQREIEVLEEFCVENKRFVFI